MVSTTTHHQADKLTTQEKLLLSQAIYKLGAISWPAISKLLSSHPCCIDRPPELFSPESCEVIYMELMAGLEINVPAPDAMKPQAKTHLRLAQTYYLKRMEELQITITTYENRFKELMGEITSLKNGEADEGIRKEIRNTIARKYGKKLLDTWFPEEEVVKRAVEDGPVSKKEEEKAKAEKDEKEAAEEERLKKEKEAEDKVVEDVEMVDGDDATPEKQDEAEAVVEPQAEEPAVEDEGTVDVENEAEDLEPESKEDIEVEEDKAEEEAEEEEPESKPEKNIKTMKTPRPRRFSPAVSVRSDHSSAPGSDRSSPLTPNAKESVPPSTRSNKRKASVQPRGAPASKRSGRRSTAAARTESVEPEPEAEPEADPEAEAEGSEEEEVHNTRGRRSARRESTRNVKKSPVSSRTKETERSPTTSRRAPSVASTNRSTPAPAPVEERRSSRRSLAASTTNKSRGMRDEVVSKSVREQSAAVESVKAETEAEEEAEDEEENKPTRTSTRRGRGGQDKEKEKEKEKEMLTPGEKRATRTSARNARDASETENTPRYTPSIADISGELETPPNSSSTRLKPTREQRSSQKLLYSLLDTIASHRNGNVFQNPVKKSEASDYYQIIKRPMDLKTIRARIKDGLITGIEEFERDVLLIFANAMMYNDTDSQVYEMAQEMLKATEDHIAHFKNLQHHVSR